MWDLLPVPRTLGMRWKHRKNMQNSTQTVTKAQEQTKSNIRLTNVKSLFQVSLWRKSFQHKEDKWILKWSLVMDSLIWKNTIRQNQAKKKKKALTQWIHILPPYKLRMVRNRRSKDHIWLIIDIFKIRSFDWVGLHGYKKKKTFSGSTTTLLNVLLNH